MDFKKSYLKFQFSLKKRIGIYDKLASFLDAKTDLTTSLKKMRDRYARPKGIFKRTDFRADILNEWIKGMESGQRFSDAIADWVPAGELMLVEAGERGGELVTGLSEAVILSTSASKNKSAIIGGLAFPTLLFAMLGGMLIMFQIQMVPVFEDLLPVSQWPDTAKTLNSISGFVYHQMWLLIIILVSLAVLISKTMGTWVRSPREIFDKLPPWNIYRSYQASSFLIALSSLLRNGVPAYNCLKTMEKNSSKWMRSHLVKMMSAMSLGGGNVGRALNTGLLDDETAGDVEDYSSTGNFSDAIYKIGAQSLEKGIKDIELRMAGVKNLLLIMVAGSIIWIYLASFGLQLEISDSLSRMR